MRNETKVSDLKKAYFILNRIKQAHESGIAKLVWATPEYGDAVACICSDGSVSLWEELPDDSQSLIWKLCHLFEGAATARAVNLQFGLSSTALKMVVAYSDGHVKVYELLDPLELKKWQLQAEFQNVIDSVSRFGNPTCLSASIAWNPHRGDEQQFILGFNSDLPQFNSAKIWEFEEDHQRWVPVAELALPEDKGERVHAVAWAPNIGRPYEIIAVATCKGIAIWHVEQQADQDGRLSTKKVVLLSGHDGEIWQVEWDMSGMTLASTGADGMVRLWQCNLNGIWQEQAALDCCHAQD
ncbi:hypothetical protein QJS10_CPA03g00206 [Acorus calamus]|uniref:Protein SEH1 n=1 Tax=Acorus calamus TaxID=4465 RepID=A0AAV9FD41_ACOCL|nr:hypothetical protein QJS10_CPA03g00206 [Acorus calamus]